MPFDKTVVVPLDPDATFDLVTKPERLRRWQAVAARVDLHAGGEYRWTIVPGHSAAGTFREVEPGRRVVFSWGWEGDDELPPGSSIVSVTLTPTTGGTEVRLVHDGLDDVQAARHAEGWDHYLDRLVAAATTGDAGPDEWAAAPDHLDELSSAEAALAVTQRVSRNISDGDMTKQTPCTEYTVSQLAEHLIRSITNLGSAAGAKIVDDPTKPLEIRIADAAQPALEAWRERGLDGNVSLGSSPMPATMIVGILSLEFLVHAWDLAAAVDREAAIDPALAEYVLGLAHAIIPKGDRTGTGFAEAIPVEHTADSLERLIAYTGRPLRTA
ncbi:TIGR03086 family protein [Rhodococcus sp. WMMA185]|uniref:TIGR03086 family metal-binding protein n=1 Tax=Rhodococcus sp. WMMA185 TaxID=679318 RepID=UPI000878D133|nr:TIGR03086 family metal-binding protein [Rhodococcus sp. WMMA185]AOW93752.1 TIGR03086 family protein [Rhodococcus sp. WMMA185]